MKETAYSRSKKIHKTPGVLHPKCEMRFRFITVCKVENKTMVFKKSTKWDHVDCQRCLKRKPGRK